MFLAFLKGSIGPRWRKQQGLPKPSIDSSAAIVGLRAGTVSIPGPTDQWWPGGPGVCLCPTAVAESREGSWEQPVSKVQPADPVRRSLCGPSGCLVLGPQAMAAGVETGVPSRQGFKV